MNRKDIADRQAIERYLHGRLTADEEQAFEESYLGDPALLDELLLTEKLEQGLKAHGDAGLRIPRRPRWLEALASAQYATAATVLLALSVLFSGTLYVENRSLTTESAARAPAPAVTRLLPLVTVRGSNPNLVAAPGSDEWTVFLVDAGFTEYDDYRAVVSRRTADDSERVSEQSGLIPTYDGMLAVGLPGDRLTLGDYDILVEGRMQDWPTARGFEQIAQTPFRIVAEQ